MIEKIKTRSLSFKDKAGIEVSVNKPSSTGGSVMFPITFSVREL